MIRLLIIIASTTCLSCCNNAPSEPLYAQEGLSIEITTSGTYKINRMPYTIYVSGDGTYSACVQRRPSYSICHQGLVDYRRNNRVILLDFATSRAGKEILTNTGAYEYYDPQAPVDIGSESIPTGAYDFTDNVGGGGNVKGCLKRYCHAMGARYNSPVFRLISKENLNIELGG